jgi:hypothetical protein
MPDEFHCLTFSQAELKQALEADPAGALNKTPGGDITVVDMVFDCSIQNERKIEIGEDPAMEALAAHCQANAVPLPRESRKALRVNDQKLCLDICMGQGTEVLQ